MRMNEKCFGPGQRLSKNDVHYISPNQVLTHAARAAAEQPQSCRAASLASRFARTVDGYHDPST